MKKTPNKTEHKNHLAVCFSRKQAEIFLDMFGRDERFKDVCKELDEELKPIFVYEIECSDCPRKFEIRSSEKLEESRIKEGGICVICSDDYK